MVIQFPYVVFRWHNPNRGICGIEDYITDIEKKRYGFNLMAGTEMYCITYDGLRRGFIMIIESTEKERMIKVMTKEIAIHNLFALKLRSRVPSDREALDLAIKALEQQPSDDCISREAVNTLIDELARAISDERCFVSRGRATSTIMQDILDLPSVTPTRPKGKIICKAPYGWGYCSECNHVVEPQDRFCSFCGADMRESESE